ncbi:hypothetical protein AMD24_00521 [Candidatus Xiphinematobacter sp. Idaho Grape]|nr:hypothetical protein AMD24_00521 [Candidatus Xiphinematobacter sp. Idaho Grape]
MERATEWEGSLPSFNRLFLLKGPFILFYLGPLENLEFLRHFVGGLVSPIRGGHGE